MDHDAKSKFILALHKHSLKAFADGGTALSGPGQDAVTLNASEPGGVTGAVGGVLGMNNDFQAGSANIQAGTNVDQLNKAYQGVQGGLAGQQAFVNQAAAQNGFGNQSNVFAQQQALANQLQQRAAGGGPNPAQDALNQATSQNVANQTAMMAGQRGAGANAGLIARQAAQQGAATQQQAVGQSATLQAQQQIAAQQALAGQQAQMQGVAANQIAAYGQGANAYSNAQQNAQGILQGANQAYNNAAVSQQANINSVNQQTAAGNQNQSNNTMEIVKGIGGAIPGIGSLFHARGGMIESPKMFAEGGLSVDPMPSPAAGPQSFVGQWLNASPSNLGAGPDIGNVATNPQYIPPQKGGGGSPAKTPGPASMGEATAPGIEGATAVGVDPAALASVAALAASGGPVKAKTPSQKAVAKDNSYANDKIPALLSEGELVIPRSIMMHPMAAEKAAAFVQAALNKKRMSKK